MNNNSNNSMYLSPEVKTRGRKPARKNEKFNPAKLSTGDTLVELLTRTKYALTI